MNPYCDPSSSPLWCMHATISSTSAWRGSSACDTCKSLSPPPACPWRYQEIIIRSLVSTLTVGTQKKCFVWVFNCVSRWWTQQHRSLKYKRIEGENRAQVWPRLSFWGRRGMHVQDYHHHHHHLLLFFEGNEGEPSIMHRPAFFIACLWDLIINRMWVGWQVRSALSELTSEADRS